PFYFGMHLNETENKRLKSKPRTSQTLLGNTQQYSENSHSCVSLAIRGAKFGFHGFPYAAWLTTRSAIHFPAQSRRSSSKPSLFRMQRLIMGVRSLKLWDLAREAIAAYRNVASISALCSSEASSACNSSFACAREDS